MTQLTAREQTILEQFCAGQSENAYELFGAQLGKDGRCRFTVWAPNAQKVWLKGDFSGWEGLAMERLDCGAWTLEVEGVKNGQIYKYAVVDRNGHTVDKADPFAAHCETAPRNGSRVWDCGGYRWEDTRYRNKRAAADPIASPINIYELHLGSWRAPKEGGVTYRESAEALAAYCKEMGYSHVELMPLTEYPFEPSWGYQVTGYFAPTSRYGTPQDFMYFVDTLHKAGIGVIMDWVPAHFPRDDFGLAYFDGTATYERPDPWMAAHPDWGTLIFDYENPIVQSFLKSSAACFLDRYHIDGLRVDAVSSMLYLGFGRGENYRRNKFGGNIDLGAVELLRGVNALAKRRGCITIAEESTAYAGVSAPAENGGLGFTFKWDMGFMHDTLDYMALDPLWRKGSHNKLTFSMFYAFSEHFILSFSHDEVVHGKRSMLDKMPGDYDQKFANLRALWGYVMAHPGKKLLFMGGEFGQFIEWNFKQPLDWFLLDYERHFQLHEYMKKLNHFYLKTPALWQKDDGWDGFDWLNVDDADRSSVAFLRTAADGSRIVCVCNFTPMAWDFRVALPCAGTLKKALSSDDAAYGGSGELSGKHIRSEEVPFLNHSHSAMLRLPPMSCTYYRFEAEEA